MKESPMNVLPLEKQIQVIGALTEGLSMRSVARLFDVERNTVGRLALRVGNGCERLHDRMMRGLQVNLIQLDEQWDYVAKKQKRVRSDDPAEYGDTWLYIALSATHKAVLSYIVGKAVSREHRSAGARFARSHPESSADHFGRILAIYRRGSSRISDRRGFRRSHKKVFERFQSAGRAHRYSPGHVSGIEKVVIRGNPDEDEISTSYVERFNLSKRMASRRFTRLTNGFSKRLENHCAAVALWISFYNFCRVHESSHDARNGAWRDGSHLVGRRVDQRSERAVWRAADSARGTDHAATGNTAI